MENGTYEERVHIPVATVASMSIRHIIRSALSALLIAAAVSACGGGTQEGGTQDEDAASPSCADLWEPGATLPDPYRGCAEGDEEIAPIWFKCDDGTRYAEWNDGEAYAKEGGKVINTAGELAKLCDSGNESAGSDRTAALRKANKGAAWLDAVNNAVETEPGRLTVATAIVDPRGDSGSPAAMKAIDVCNAAVALLEKDGTKEPHVSVMEKDGTTFVVYGHPDYPDGCTEI